MVDVAPEDFIHLTRIFYQTNFQTIADYNLFLYQNTTSGHVKSCEQRFTQLNIKPSFKKHRNSPFERKVKQWLVFKALVCERPDVSIRRDEEAVGKRFISAGIKSPTAASVTPQVEDTL